MSTFLAALVGAAVGAAAGLVLFGTVSVLVGLLWGLCDLWREYHPRRAR